MFNVTKSLCLGDNQCSLLGYLWAPLLGAADALIGVVVVVSIVSNKSFFYDA